MSYNVSSKDKTGGSAGEDCKPFLRAVDEHVGKRLRQRRLLLGMTQADIGSACYLPFQQIQKYESGKNRIGAGRLFQFARLLCVDVDWFYKDMPQELRQPVYKSGFGERGQDALNGAPQMDNDAPLDRDAIKLLRTYSQISNPRQKDNIRRLIESMATATNKKTD